MKTRLLHIVLAMYLCVIGCTPETRVVDTRNDPGKAVIVLDYRDFAETASEMVQSMIGSGALNKPGGGRYVMTTGKIQNDTMQRIDTDQLMAKIEEDLLNSGRVVMTAAVGGKGAPDQMVYDTRDIRDSDIGTEFDPNTLPGKGRLLMPELSTSGKIIQKVLTYSKKEQQVEYYFQLRVTNLANGLVLWQKEDLIVKRGSKKTVAW
ncbi:MAG TPA: penicillin-binding protein activator LpoB [Phycisphaerales bacterium]|nr:penicillin-binding protein activator LpoB [Phycisphaerales bacterium]